jgi:hypothetical protein
MKKVYYVVQACALTIASIGITFGQVATKPLYELPRLPKDIVLVGWEKIGGYNGPQVVLDEPPSSASSLHAVTLDSHLWGDPSLVKPVDTTLIADTGAPYVAGTAYRLTFAFARYDTAGAYESEKNFTFFGAFAYQLWAGHPEKGGTLLASANLPALDTVGPSNNQRINLLAPAHETGEGTLFIRFMSKWRKPSEDMDLNMYQQAEVSDLKLELNP